MEPSKTEGTIPSCKIKKSLAKINADFKRVATDWDYTRVVVRLHYGPYKINGITEHRVQKLRGLIECLKKCEYIVELIPSNHLNRLEVEILGYEVYRLNIKNMQFNVDCDFDPVCLTTLSRIEEATKRLYRNKNIAKNMHLIARNPDLSETTDDE